MTSVRDANASPLGYRAALGDARAEAAAWAAGAAVGSALAQRLLHSGAGKLPP